MNFVKVWLFKWLGPLWMSALDECNKKNLVNYYKNQDEFMQKMEVSQSALMEYIQSAVKDSKASAQYHKDYLDRLDKLIDVLVRIEAKP